MLQKDNDKMAEATDGPPTGKSVGVGDYEIHYHEAGEGPAVVFVHGSGPGASGYSNFKQNYLEIANAGFRVIVPDLPGFGYSTKPTGIDYTTDLFARTLRDALQAIGVEKCALIGNSLGGAVSIYMALEYPDFVDRLVLMAPGGLEEKETYFAQPSMRKMVESFVGGKLDMEGVRKVLGYLAYDPSTVTDELVAERFAVLQTQPPDVLSRMIIPNMEGRLADIACPVLGFWGVDDGMTPPGGAQKLLAACAHCRFVIVSRCGHWVMAEYPRMFNAATIDFLKAD